MAGIELKPASWFWHLPTRWTQNSRVNFYKLNHCHPQMETDLVIHLCIQINKLYEFYHTMGKTIQSSSCQNASLYLWVSGDSEKRNLLSISRLSDGLLGSKTQAFSLTLLHNILYHLKTYIPGWLPDLYKASFWNPSSGFSRVFARALVYLIHS